MRTFESIKGKTVIITGGCGHIGRKTCSEIVGYGGNVIILDRKEAIDGNKIENCEVFECDRC